MRQVNSSKNPKQEKSKQELQSLEVLFLEPLSKNKICEIFCGIVS